MHLLVEKLKMNVKMHGEHNVKLTSESWKMPVADCALLFWPECVRIVTKMLDLRTGAHPGGGEGGTTGLQSLKPPKTEI